MVGFLEGWLAGKAMKKTRQRLREKLGPVEDEEPTLLDMAPAQGARWLQQTDGTWKRWSYLGESWEAVAQPPATLPPDALTDTPASPVEWTQQPDGVWDRTST